MASIANKWIAVSVEVRGNDADIVVLANGDAILERRGLFATTFGARLDSPPAINVTQRQSWSSIEIHATQGDHAYHLCLQVKPEQRWISGTESVHSMKEPQLDPFEASWSFLCEGSDREVFSQALVPEKDDIIGEHSLRSPAVTVQSGSRAAVLALDVSQLRLNAALPAMMNLVQEGKTTKLSVGRSQYDVRGHVYYKRQAKTGRGFVLSIVYDIFASAEAQPGEALAWSAKHLWQRHASNVNITPLPMTHAEIAEEIYCYAFAKRWHEVTVNGKRVGSVACNRSYARDVWLCAWFNQMHTAYGYYHWGKKCNKPEWVDRALAVRDLVLSAPARNGLFPTVVIFPKEGASLRWVGSHHQGGGPGILHLMDMSWTMVQLLAFARDLVPHPESVKRAREYCQAVLKLQREDGGLPAYVTEDTHQPVTKISNRDLLRDIENSGGETYVPHMLKNHWVEQRYTESAEDSATLLVLAELAHALPKNDAFRSEAINGAERIAGWLERWVFPQSRWLDMEINFSCAPKPLGWFDERSQQWPQNTLVMNFAARFRHRYSKQHHSDDDGKQDDTHGRSPEGFL